MPKKTCLLAFCLLLTGISAMAADLAWLVPGARQNAMGGAFSSVADDSYAVFYNPAALSGFANFETGLSVGRRLSPLGGAGESALTYIRPWPDTAGLTFGFGYYAVRQGARGSRDAASFEMGSRTTFKYFQRPILYGGGLKLISLRNPKRSRFGLGFDAGVMLESNYGLKTSLVLTDVALGLGRTPATITLGNSYRYGGTVFSVDMRARDGYSEFFLGAEKDLFNGLLQARAGKGVKLNGTDYLALGLGVNASPWTLDFAWSLPWRGFNNPAGFYGASAAYRFGAPSFSSKLVGEAARRAEELKTQINDLRTQKAVLESSIATSRVGKNVLESDLTLMQTRLREMEVRSKQLELEILDTLGRKEKPKPVKTYVPPPPEKWPRSHKVGPGETLRSIASQYYGNPNFWEKIYEANEKNISKGLPVEGAVLTIPAPPP